MRQKKSKTIFYIIAIVAVLAIGYALTRDALVKTETVEEVVEVNIVNE